MIHDDATLRALISRARPIGNAHRLAHLVVLVGQALMAHHLAEGARRDAAAAREAARRTLILLDAVALLDRGADRAADARGACYPLMLDEARTACVQRLLEHCC